MLKCGSCVDVVASFPGSPCTVTESMAAGEPENKAADVVPMVWSIELDQFLSLTGGWGQAIGLA